MKTRTFLLSFLVVSSFAAADKPVSYLMPNTQIFLTPEFSNGTDAFYLMGELGPKNYRGMVTYGRDLGGTQRFKISGEYLTQKLKYDFSTGRHEKWVRQAGVGAVYQYIFDCGFFKTIDAGLSYAHAYNRSFHKQEFLINDFSFTLKQRIAGSDAFLSYLGATVNPWCCGYFSAALNYDWVNYNRHYERRKHVDGFGVSMNYTQQMGREFILELDADIRRPFQFYQGSLSWDKVTSKGQFTLGVYGNYTIGNEHLPNVAAAGIQLGFAFGSNCCDDCYCDYSDCNDRFFCDIAQWVLDPPLFAPVVLAIADEKITQTPICPTCPICPPPGTCCQPTVVQIPDFNLPVNATQVNIRQNSFTSCSTYTVTSSPTIPDLTVDPITGTIIVVNDHSGLHTVTVEVTNDCGNTASQSFDVTLN